MPRTRVCMKKYLIDPGTKIRSGAWSRSRLRYKFINIDQEIKRNFYFGNQCPHLTIFVKLDQLLEVLSLRTSAEYKYILLDLNGIGVLHQFLNPILNLHFQYIVRGIEIPQNIMNIGR